MININKVKSDKTIKEKIKSFKKSKNEKIEVMQSPFYDKLLEITEVEDIKLELDQLIEQIDKVGKKFARDANINNLKEYKSLIKAFLNTVINKMYKVKEKYGHRSWVKQKVFIIVEKINKKLELLTKFILEKENENINLLATLDEIRGLLVDLYK